MAPEGLLGYIDNQLTDHTRLSVGQGCCACKARAEAAIHAVSHETEDWESVEVIMDSGAHVSVGPRELGRKAGYKVQESPGSRAGVCYTAANGGELPNLGQRFMAVLTEEGTLKGMEQQVADVTKPLEAVRANLMAGHAVVFDDDGTGQGTGKKTQF